MSWRSFAKIDASASSRSLCKRTRSGGVESEVAQHMTNFQIVDAQRLVDEQARGDSSVPASTLHVGLVGELGNASAMTDSPAEGNQEARNEGKPESNGG